jgi:hypothetical protein
MEKMLGHDRTFNQSTAGIDVAQSGKFEGGRCPDGGSPTIN